MVRNAIERFFSAGACFALVLACLMPAAAQTFAGVLTQHNDTARTGQNLNETILTPANVTATKFGKVFSYSVDGQIYAQPLYVPNVTIPGQGTHNVVYVATQNDSIYAFDADGLQSTPLWQISFVNPAAGITPVLCATGRYCSLYPMVGINSTPVIDPTTNTMYVVSRAESKSKGPYQNLHAIDITTGAEKFGGPVNITGSVLGTGTDSVGGVITFPANQAIQRAGLLEANGMIYIGWAGIEHGWVMAYNAQTLQQEEIFNTTPNWQGGGVWASGNGLVADANGNIFVAVADGGFDVNTGGTDYGDSLVKFDANLNVLDYFTPMDQSCRAVNDMDLGSGGPMLLPAQPGSVPNEILIAGKGGLPCDTNPADSPIYLVNQDSMGKYNATQDSDVQDIVGSAGGYWSSPTYWQGPSATYVYYGGVAADAGGGDYMKMYSVTNGLLSAAPVSQSSNLFPVGATPSISANGTSNGIVWAIERVDPLGTSPGIKPAVLAAYNATGISSMLYNSSSAKSNGVLRDRGGCANKFAVPTIANGRVYVGTQNELDVFGLLGSTSGPELYLGNPCWAFPVSALGTQLTQTITVVNSGNSTLTISNVAITGLNAADFTQTNTCTTLAPGKGCGITITFKSTILGKPESASVLITDNAVGSPHNIFVTGAATN